MPVSLSDHLPLPSLRFYAVLSLMFLSFGCFYSRNERSSESSLDYYETDELHSPTGFGSLIGKDSMFTWSIINIAYCGLFMFGKLIQRFVFGDLRLVEQQSIHEKFWNFVFYKVIFVFGVINAQTMVEVAHWMAWFSMFGFWKIFGQLCSDRFDFIMSSPTLSRKPNTKLLILIIVIILSSASMSVAAFHSEFAENLNIFGFMLAECILLGLECLHMLTNYGIHFIGYTNDENWERKTMKIYYIDLVFHVIIHGIDLLHHFHMLLWSNVFLSMASLVLYWNIRTISSDLSKSIRKHKLYKRVTQCVEEKFEFLGETDLSEYDDNCAICWDSMNTARKLPCGHVFHQSCLCSWLQQDPSCPTCRVSLANAIDLTEGQALNHLVDSDIDQRQFADLQVQGNQRNHFFHFDGSQIANWFPSFSIEVFHAGTESSENELEQMAVQVQSMFPTIPYSVILDDIRRTQSPEATAENILEGNIIFPQETEPEDIRPVEEAYVHLDQQPALPNDEAPGKASSRTSSESESSDASSCFEFHDNSEKRQEKFQKRRGRLLTDTRRRFTGRGIEQRSRCTQSSKSKQSSVVLDHDDKKGHVPQNGEGKLLGDDELKILNELN